ncbi:chromosomal replication initiator protein DnaA [Mycoplasmopsis pulmonis]|uniref:chromosomal replication initiator protein DnaA n=1 Tax=Mycoplasmopsis pulmonis TaxID=2107 RepID=UPI002ACEF9CE|nr:chromosomal replication initiator protein DnaA [Mycoplasmopsis pulmonis]MDZ7293375.1 chromosomal replication initiator protein DnaA [Mycoplasmopsis pulmonis]
MSKKSLDKIDLLAYNKTLQDIFESKINDSMLYQNIFKFLEITKVTFDQVKIAAPNQDVINHLNSDFKEDIKDCIFQLFGENREITFTSGKKDSSESPKKSEENIQLIEESQNNDELIKKFTFDNFIQSKFNENAFLIGKEIIENPGIYNPVLISGDSGLGKTHLLNAIGNEFLKKYPKSIVKFLTPSDFYRKIMPILSSNNINENAKKFKELTEADLVMFDDFQIFSIGNKRATLNFIFEILDKRIMNNKVTILTSDKDLKFMASLFEQRLYTRLSSGLSVEIEQPNKEDMLKILKFQLKIKNLSPEKWEKDALDFMVRNFSKSIRFLEGALDKVHFFQLKKQINEFNKLTISNIFKNVEITKENTTPERIIEHVANYYKLPKHELISKSRKSNLVVARDMAIYLIREDLNYSFSRIGLIFSNRDHSTIFNSHRKISQSINSHDSTKYTITTLRSKINKLS